MSREGGQLYYHLGAAMNTGLTEAQMHEFISMLAAGVDKQRVDDAGVLLDMVLKNRK